MAVKLSPAKQRVERKLERHEVLRDNDNYLIGAIWSDELIDEGIDPRTISARAFFLRMKKGEHTSSESIRRCRQKIQEERPALRGKHYKKRQANQSVIKQELKETPNQSKLFKDASI